MDETDEQERATPPRSALHERLLEVARFLAVGGAAFVVDLGLFNLLCYGPGHLLGAKPITAKILSLAAATAVSWIGNRHWTFATHASPARGRELFVFVVINLLGAAIPVLTLAFSRYVLDQTSQLSDNAWTVTGIAVGTLLRYFGYKAWVFTARPAQEAVATIV
ncbi:GtrA family protein [Cellulomonas sp. HZM]|uniref:GtrA family protein n=1 Tax=Cellulomonas sp. HZM TaxID=1454010 RepID=UPI00068F48FA|nr:GtrA family protein [Cellulomonas sp. HZM]